MISEKENDAVLGDIVLRLEDNLSHDTFDVLVNQYPDYTETIERVFFSMQLIRAFKSSTKRTTDGAARGGHSG